MTLNTMPLRQSGTIQNLSEPDGHTIVHRLGELGFIPGETITVLHRAHGNLAVRIGDSMFALRAIEAECIRVNKI